MTTRAQVASRLANAVCRAAGYRASALPIGLGRVLAFMPPPPAAATARARPAAE